MSRFFTAPENIGEKSIVIDNKTDLHHMKKVLRLQEGDKIDVSDGQQWEYKVVVRYLGDEECVADIVDKQMFAREPNIKVTLFQGIPKQGKMETIVQKTVELGIYEIVPVFMARTVVADKGNFGKKLQRWQKVSDEAVKQCKRGIIPQIREPLKINEVVECFKDYDYVIFPYENEEKHSLKDVLKDIDNIKKGASIAVIVGPEGGFSDDEADLIVSSGGRSASLGKTILRTETAGMAALAMIMYEMEL